MAKGSIPDGGTVYVMMTYMDLLVLGTIQKFFEFICFLSRMEIKMPCDPPIS